MLTVIPTVTVVALSTGLLFLHAVIAAISGFRRKTSLQAVLTFYNTMVSLSATVGAGPGRLCASTI